MTRLQFSYFVHTSYLLYNIKSQVHMKVTDLGCTQLTINHCQICNLQIKHIIIVQQMDPVSNVNIGESN